MTAQQWIDQIVELVKRNSGQYGQQGPWHTAIPNEDPLLRLAVAEGVKANPWIVAQGMTTDVRPNGVWVRRLR